MKKAILNDIEKFLVDYLEKINYELVELIYIKENGKNILRAFVFSFDGVDLDICSEISRELGNFIDQNDYIDDAYNLEISSPGIDRPIRTDDDMRRNIGKSVELKLYKRINDKKSYTGILSSYDDDNIVLKSEGNFYSFERSNIASLKQTIIF